MQTVAKQVDDCWVVDVEGRLDIGNAGRFEQECLSWITQGKIQLVLDFSKLEYISSAGLRSILSAAKRAGSLGGSVSLCGLNGLVQEVVSLSGFDNILAVYPDAGQAVDRAKK